MDNIQVSRHAKERIKERCGQGKGKAEEIAIRAVTRGVEREFTKGQLRKWLDLKYRDGHRLYAYGDKAYLFSAQNVLITVLQMPPEITRIPRNRMIVLPA